jgi:hydrogenase nickel incorporation protein HypA/HybF
MHELSLAMETIELATREAEKTGVSLIREIVIEVGCLSGVEADAFEFALELMVKGSVLENAIIRLIRTPGHGKCTACNLQFIMRQRLDTCPECSSFPSEIRGGENFMLLSMVVE